MIKDALMMFFIVPPQSVAEILFYLEHFSSLEQARCQLAIAARYKNENGVFASTAIEEILQFI